MTTDKLGLKKASLMLYLPKTLKMIDFLYPSNVPQPTR